MSEFVPTPEQAQALAAPAPLLVLAGAGTGKTTVLTRRIAGLIASGQARPDQVLALTFTEKAATEMAERLAEILSAEGMGDAAREVAASTFHSFGGRIVRENLLRLGFDRSPAVLSVAASWRLPASIFDDLDFQAIEVATGEVAATFRHLLGFFSRCKDHLVTPEDLEGYLASVDAASLSPAAAEHLQGRLAEWADAAAAYRRYEGAKRERGLVDFGDHLLLPVKLLQSDPDLCESYRRRYPFIFVDEYQDTNHSQRLLLLQLIDPKRPDIMVIGDDDQAIYRWRGAVVHNILHFDKEEVFGRGQVRRVPMTLNRRSYPPILELANRAIALVSERHEKELDYHPLNREGRATIGHYLAASDRAEMAWIARQIRALEPEARGLPGKKVGYGAFAILCRKRVLFTPVGRALEEAGIPYELVGGTGFYGRWEIRDVLSYLRLLASPADDIAAARILRSPRWRLSGRDIYHLGAWVAKSNGGRGREAEERPEAARLHLRDAVLRHEEVSGLSAAAHERLERLGAELRAFAEARGRLPLPELVGAVIDGTGYRRELEARGGFDARVALLNLAKLEQLAREFAAGEEEAELGDFVAYVTYAVESGEEEDEVRPVEEETDCVKVMTVHRAKGLEFPIVFVPGLAEGIFPDAGRDESDKWWAVPWELRGDREHVPRLAYDAIGSKKDLEAALKARKEAEKALQLDEERRLFYVAITRAQRRLYLSRAHWYGATKKWREGSAFWELVVESGLSQNLGEEECPAENPNRRTGDAAAEAPIVHGEGRPDGFAALLRSGADPTPRLEEMAMKEGEGRWAALRAEVDAHLEEVLADSAPVPAPSAVEVSVSGLLLYLACPRRYRYVYVDRLPVRPSPAGALGREVHRRIEELSRPAAAAAAEAGTGSPDEAGEAGLEREVEELLGPSEVAEAAGEPRAGVEQMLARYRGSVYGRRPATFVELPFQLSLAGGVVRGRIDRLDRLDDGRWELVDFKTGRRHEEALAAYRAQLAIYALAVSESFGVPAERMLARALFLADGSEVEVPLDGAAMASVRRDVEIALERIPRGEFPATEADLCGRCDYGHLCACSTRGSV